VAAKVTADGRVVGATDSEAAAERPGAERGRLLLSRHPSLT
jgi:hypothetical protein